MELETESCKDSETRTPPCRVSKPPPAVQGSAADGLQAAGAVSRDFSDCPEERDRGQERQLQSQGGALETAAS